jgi:murein DD-endopeptidase MepM/ murein hydrolase activator NlpD
VAELGNAAATDTLLIQVLGVYPWAQGHNAAMTITDAAGFLYSHLNRLGFSPAWVILAAVENCAVAQAADQPQFKLPVECQLGFTCFVQNYVDHDPTAGYRDFSCGGQTYNGHDGTDFRLPSLTAQRQGVAVIAAASGNVVGVRDGVRDISIRSIGKRGVQGRECGNGVLLSHNDGWETQYCHLAQDSLRVTKGQVVQTGQVLGTVGLSGMTEFPHLHFTVRHRGVVVDPFAPQYAAGNCDSASSLWDAATAKDAVYRRRVALNVGFASRLLTMEELESHQASGSKLDDQSPALVAFIRMIGLQSGDVQSLAIDNPQGVRIAQTTLKPLERARAQSLVMVGGKKPASGWGPGVYRAQFQVTNEGKVVFERIFAVQIE